MLRYMNHWYFPNLVDSAKEPDVIFLEVGFGSGQYIDLGIHQQQDMLCLTVPEFHIALILKEKSLDNSLLYRYRYRNFRGRKNGKH
jgi:hypothetical protein